MSKLLHRSLLAGSIMTIVAACGGGDEAENAAASDAAGSQKSTPAAASQSAMWESIAADTPFLYAYDGASMDRDLVNTMLASNHESMQAMLEQMQADASMNDEAAGKLALAVVKEFATVSDIASMEALGLSADGYITLSARGIDPVMQISLSDEEAFMAMIERVVLAAEVELPEPVMHKDHRLWEVPMEELGALIIGVGGGKASIGTIADPADVDAKEMVLGIQKPANSMAGSERIAQMQQRYGFDGINLGFIGVADLLNAVSDPGSNPIKDRILAISGEQELVPAACVALVKSFGEVMPQIALGSTSINSDQISIRSVIELTGSTPEQLQAIAAPVPGMGKSNESALARYSMALSLPALRTALNNLSSGLREVSGDCPWIEPGALDNLDRSAMQLANPMFSGVKGLHLELDTLDLMPGMMMPNDVRAQLLIAADNPLGLLGLAAMASPQLAQLNLKADSQPVAVGPEIIPPLVPAPHLAASETALAMSVGEGNQETLPDFLAGPTSDKATLLRISYDASKLAELIEAQMEAAGDSAPAGFNASSLGAFDWVEIEVYSNEHGLILDQASHMRD